MSSKMWNILFWLTKDLEEDEIHKKLDKDEKIAEKLGFHKDQNSEIIFDWIHKPPEHVKQWSGLLISKDMPPSRTYPPIADQ
jgi:hypothetical protein